MPRVRTLLCLAMLSLSLTARSAHAQDAPPARPLRISLGLGPAVGIPGGGAGFIVGEEVEYSIANTPVGAPFVGLALAQTFGAGFLFQFGARAGFDFTVLDTEAVDLLVAPAVVLGAALGEGPNAVAGYFHAEISGELRALFADGLVGVWIRPIAFEVFAGDLVFGRWHLMVGASIQL
jgi:hypothetical protein